MADDKPSMKIGTYFSEELNKEQARFVANHRATCGAGEPGALSVLSEMRCYQRAIVRYLDEKFEEESKLLDGLDGFEEILLDGTETPDTEPPSPELEPGGVATLEVGYGRGDDYEEP
jgi:hypothetical protein